MGDAKYTSAEKAMPTWKQEYQLVCQRVTWARPLISDQCFDFFLQDSMLVRRAGEGYFPKAISTQPLRATRQRISLLCKYQTEVALMTSPSKEALREDLDRVSLEKPFGDYGKNLKEEAACMSFFSDRISYKIKQKDDVSQQDPQVQHISIKREDPSYYYIHVDIDKKAGTVTWSRWQGRPDLDVIGSAPLPAEPFWLVYLNGESGAGVRVLSHKEFVNTEPASLFKY